MSHQKQTDVTSVSPIPKRVVAKSAPPAKTPIVSPFMLMPELCTITTFTPQYIYQLIREGEFPPPVKLTKDGRRSAWNREFIPAWVQERLNNCQG